MFASMVIELAFLTSLYGKRTSSSLIGACHCRFEIRQLSIANPLTLTLNDSFGRPVKYSMDVTKGKFDSKYSHDA
jgi:hypothetical protein